MTEKSPERPAGSEIVLYQAEDGQSRIQVRLEGGTVWLSQALMAELFLTTPQNITIHIGEIYEDGELSEAATCKEHLQVRQEGSRAVRRQIKLYSLEMILAVGYRVRSPRGVQFRQWAIERLREYLIKGFTLDDERLKGHDRLAPKSWFQSPNETLGGERPAELLTRGELDQVRNVLGTLESGIYS